MFVLLFGTQAHAAPHAKRATTKATNAKAKAKTKAKAARRTKPAARRQATRGLVRKARSPMAEFRLANAKTNTKSSLRVPRLQIRTRSVKQLEYLRDGISEQQVRKIQSVVDGLKASSPKDLIVFRGQDKLTKEVRAEVRREHPLAESVREYKKAAKSEADTAAEFIKRITEARYPGARESRYAAHLSTLSGQEMLAIKSQHQFASRFLVSTTRDLSIAFGDFYMAPKVRYIYIMQVPKEHTINVHGLVADKTKSLKVLRPDNQREKELAIPLQATEYVRAVYDIKANKVIKFKSPDP